MGRVDGKVILVTGGAQGIGLAVARRVAQEGATPIIADRKRREGEAAATNIGGGTRFVELDVTSEENWAEVAAFVESEFDGLDGLVNNAGISGVTGIADLKPRHWRKVIDVNLTGVYLGTHIMTPLLLARGAQTECGASVVNISSIMGLVGIAGSAAYAASKGGVRLFTKSVALDFTGAGQKVRVNSVHPGFIVTPMHEEGTKRLAESGAAESPDAVDSMLRGLTPIGRLGTPEDIANGALFLLSDESSFMTGSELVMDGGYTAQ